MEVMDQHKSDFGVDFSDNKKALDKISIIRSKGLKNEIAGFITKFIKHEIREQEEKEKREKQFDQQISEGQTDEASETIEVSETITENVTPVKETPDESAEISISNDSSDTTN